VQQTAAETPTREQDLIVRYVFCYTTGQKAAQRITEIGYNKAWRKARTDAGCPARIPHDFRRTAVRNLVRASVPERVAMQLTGHKTRAVFERDNIVSAGDLREAAQRLDRFAAASYSPPDQPAPVECLQNSGPPKPNDSAAWRHERAWGQRSPALAVRPVRHRFGERTPGRP
jgi:hypothetical protein